MQFSRQRKYFLFPGHFHCTSTKLRNKHYCNQFDLLQHKTTLSFILNYINYNCLFHNFLLLSWIYEKIQFVFLIKTLFSPDIINSFEILLKHYWQEKIQNFNAANLYKIHCIKFFNKSSLLYQDNKYILFNK